MSKQLRLDEVGKQLDPLRNAILTVMAVGGACVVIYGWFQKGASGAAVGLLLALALFAAGALVGFLFGVPRAARGDRPTAGQPQSAPDQNPPPTNPPPSTQTPPQRYLPSTQLEDISDWLTKILIGLGLAQIREVPAALHSFSTFAAMGIGGGTSTPTLIMGTFLLFTVCGFFVGYLWCRLLLAILQSVAEAT